MNEAYIYLLCWKQQQINTIWYWVKALDYSSNVLALQLYNAVTVLRSPLS